MRVKKYSLIAGIYPLMKRTYWLVLALALSASVVKAQDQTNFTQFYLNPYLINPSYVGIDGQSALSIIYRKQWMTIEGAPTIANFTLQTPISPRAGFGFSVTNDVKGLLNNFSALLTFGFNVPLADHAFIRFGISGGGSWNTVDMEKLESLSNDLALANILDNNASLTGNAGISFHINTFQLGASMPTMFAPSYMSQDAFTVTEIKPFQSLIINASNRFYFGDDKHVFEPYALYRMNAELPPQFEVAGILHLNHVIWIGGSYKQDFGISALGGIKLKNAVAIGASYSLQNSGINELNSPSVEVSLNFLFGKRKKDAPLYSFVNTVKEKEKKPLRKSASQLIAERRKAEEEARKLKLAEEAKKRKEEEEAQKQVEALAQKSREEEARRVQEEEARRAQEAEAQRLQQSEAQRVREEERVREEQRAREEARAREAQLAQNNPPPADTAGVATAPRPRLVSDGQRHETFKRGGHNRELGTGDYIIAGVFSSEANANRYTAGLRELGYAAANGFLTEKALWYVYIVKTNDIYYARAERDKVRKLRMFRDAWLLTIVE